MMMLDENESLGHSLMPVVNDMINHATTKPASFNPMFAVEERFEPCRVCGEPSSGWHCGAVTCEACKKFFLRSINGEDAKYKCVRNKDCIIARATRTQCQYCRFKKCKEVGMTINGKNPNNPTVAELFKAFACNVCKAPSSGVHFGAITCEGCKGFFRRSIKERAPERYKCMDNGNCEVSVATRNMCRFCRFQKCLQAGMSAKNSRIGRQSNLFKHQIIEYQKRGYQPDSEYLTIAARKIKSQKSRTLMPPEMDGYNEYNLYTQQPPQLHPHQSQPQPQQQDPYLQQQQQQQQLKVTTNYSPMQSMQQQIAAYDAALQQYIQPTQQPQPVVVQPNELLLQQQQQQQQQQMHHEFYYNQHHQHHQMDQNMTTIAYHPQAINQPHDIQEHQQQQHDHHNHHMFQFQTQLDMMFDKHTIDCIKLITNAYCDFKLGLVPHNEHVAQHHHQQQQLNELELNDCIEQMRIYAIKFFKFFDCIPEMNSLLMDDQNELIKNSVHSVVLLFTQAECSYLNYFNCDDLLFQKFAKSLPILYRSCEFLMRLREQFENFKLDDTEYALYAVLIISSPACQSLTQFDRVSEMRERVAEILRKYMLAKRNEEMTFDGLLLLLNNWRKFNHILQDGIFDAYQRHFRHDTNTKSSSNGTTPAKPLRKSINFTRAFLPTNFMI